MAIAFTLISVLGMIVFFKASDWPVGLVFVGLTCVYVSEFVATLFAILPGPGGQPTALNAFGERSVGFFRLLTGAWLMYITYAVTLDAASGMHLPT
jgi:hypothetical protein